MLHVVCLNVKKTSGDRLDQALATVPHRIVFHAGTGRRGPGAFDGHNGSSDRFPEIERFLEQYAGGYGADDPMLVIATGAGAEALRHWFLDDENREVVDAVLLVESGAEAERVGPSGLMEFARDCEAQPREKKLVLCRHVGAGPLSAEVGRGLAPVPPRPAAAVAGVHFIDVQERAETGQDLPDTVFDVVNQLLVPFLHDLGPASSPDPLVEHLTERNIALPSLPLGERCVAWSREQLRVLPVPSVMVMSRWLALTQSRHGTPRGGPRLTRVLGTNPSVAAASAAAHACLFEGERLPHELRANGRELVADAADAGAWFPAEVLRRERVAAAGDLVVLDRSLPGRPETAWWTQVERVVDIAGTTGDGRPALVVLGTSEAPTVRWSLHPLAYDDPGLLGVVVYPRQGGEWPLRSTSSEERAALERLADLASGRPEVAWWEQERPLSRTEA